MKPYYSHGGIEMYCGDVLKVWRTLPSDSVHCVVTSPPYWGLRDYGVPGQLGLERTPEEYVAKMVEVFREVRRVLRKDGSLWLNIGDSYATGAGSGRSMGGDCFGKQNKVIDSSSYPECQPNRMPITGLKPKDLCGIPWMLAFALRTDGWWLRSEIIWSKKNPMPESVTDRPTKAHEQLFLLTKSADYFYDAEAIKEPQSETTFDRFGNGTPRIIGTKERTAIAGEVLANSSYVRVQGVMPDGKRNRRSVWEIATAPFPEAHFATFPPKLVEPCILAGTSEKGCCPECGAPWERIFETELVPTAKAAHTFVVDERDATADDNDQGSNRQKDGHRPGWINQTTTLGWQPTCKCGKAEPVPCTVADPFGGAGTVALVARRFQRKAILSELSRDYCEIAKKRLDGPLYVPEEPEGTNQEVFQF